MGCRSPEFSPGTSAGRRPSIATVRNGRTPIGVPEGGGSGMGEGGGGGRGGGGDGGREARTHTPKFPRIPLFPKHR